MTTRPITEKRKIDHNSYELHSIQSTITEKSNAQKS